MKAASIDDIVSARCENGKKTGAMVGDVAVGRSIALFAQNPWLGPSLHKQGVVVHACNPSTQGWRQRYQKFEVYVGSLRSASAI